MSAQVLEQDTAVATDDRSDAVLVEKRDGRVVDFDPINIINAVAAAFGDLDKIGRAHV